MATRRVLKKAGARASGGAAGGADPPHSAANAAPIGDRSRQSTMPEAISSKAALTSASPLATVGPDVGRRASVSARATA